MLNLSSFLLFSENPKKLATFYEKVLGAKPDWQQGDWCSFNAVNCFITIGLHDKVHGLSKNPERIIFNFETDDVESEFKRIKALGAKVVKELYHPDEASEMFVATFADPDGNYFQLMSPFEENKTN